MASEKWYQGGLRFECTQCGNCCTGAPGYVWVTREEIRRIAEYLERDDQWLPSEILRRVGFKYSLTEKGNGDCIFLQSTGNGRRGCWLAGYIRLTTPFPASAAVSERGHG